MTNSYFNAGGVTLCMASPAHVDEILAHGPIEKVSGISWTFQPLRGAKSRLIQNAFELAITGLTDDDDQDHLHDMLREWLIDNFALDDGGFKYDEVGNRGGDEKFTSSACAFKI